jgi:hypothetical protein
MGEIDYSAPEKIVLIGRSQAGWHAAYTWGGGGQTGSSSGGSLEGYVKDRPAGDENSRGGRTAEGAFVYDGKNLSYEDAAKIAICGPIPYPLVPLGMAEYEHHYPPIYKHASECKIGSMTYVAVDVYLDYYRRAGARIGQVHNERVYWDDERVPDAVIEAVWKLVHNPEELKASCQKFQSALRLLGYDSLGGHYYLNPWCGMYVGIEKDGYTHS